MFSPCVILVTLFLNLAPTVVHGADLFPYSTHTSILSGEDDASHRLPLDVPLRVSGQDYTFLYVVTNGLLVLSNDGDSYDIENYSDVIVYSIPFSGPPIIALFWSDADMDIADSRLLVHQTTTDTQTYEDTVHLLDNEFDADWAFIATYENVLGVSRPAGIYNSYQVVLVTDLTRKKSYAIFNYNKMQWVRSSREVGYNHGNGIDFARLPGVVNATMQTDLLVKTNVGIPGRFVIPITPIQEPHCDDGWDLNPTKEACVKVVQGVRKTFLQARDYCETFGADLATSARSYLERKQVTGLIRFRGHLWIGVHDWDSNGGYTDVNGNLVTGDVPFKGGAPRRGAGHQRCVSIKQKRWFDKNCHRHFFFVCQKSPQFV